MGWFKLVLVILVVAGLTWLALFCDSWHKYREHVERLSELREEVRRRAEEDGYWVDFGLEPSYWEWNHGHVMCGLGFALLLAWTLTATARRQVSKSGNLLPSAFAGFLGIVLFGWILPIFAHFLFGLVAGLLTRGTWRIGALAGFLAGLSGEVALSALVAEGLVSLESISVAIAQIALLLWVLGIIATSIGGLVGRIMTG